MVAAASSAARGGTDTQASVTHVLQEQNLLVQSHAKQDRLGRKQRARGTMVGGGGGTGLSRSLTVWEQWLEKGCKHWRITRGKLNPLVPGKPYRKRTTGASQRTLFWDGEGT